MNPSTRFKDPDTYPENFDSGYQERELITFRISFPMVSQSPNKGERINECCKD